MPVFKMVRIWFGDLGVLNTGKGKGLRELVDGIGAQKIEIPVLPD
jgi:hypothetical protein